MSTARAARRAFFTLPRAPINPLHYRNKGQEPQEPQRVVRQYGSIALGLPGGEGGPLPGIAA
jgi:hypothetical protein